MASPQIRYDSPYNGCTADVIGNPSSNLVKSKAGVDAEGMTETGPMGTMTFPRCHMTDQVAQSGEMDVILGVRPEQVSILREKDEGTTEGRVYSGMLAGSETLVSVRVGNEMITVKEIGSTRYASDEVVYLKINPEKINVFDAASENLIKYCM